jgi:hypothetical protein
VPNPTQSWRSHVQSGYSLSADLNRRLQELAFPMPSPKRVMPVTAGVVEPSYLWVRGYEPYLIRKRAADCSNLIRDWDSEREVECCKKSAVKTATTPSMTPRKRADTNGLRSIAVRTAMAFTSRTKSRCGKRTRRKSLRSLCHNCFLVPADLDR